MNKKLIFSVVFFLILINISSCTKDEQYDPEELVVTIKVSNWDYFYMQPRFIVVENKKSETVYIELSEDGTYTMKRDNKIVGNHVNIHFVYISSFMKDNHWKINSYFEMPLGKEITIDDSSSFKNSDNAPSPDKAIANIDFSDVPDFDVATRSAHHPLHCHTLPTLEVPCSLAGGNTYPTGENFYVCLQKNDSGSYKLVSIPEVSDYTISLTELNNNMTKHSVPKNSDYEWMTLSVKASGSGSDLKIFSWSSNEESIFPGNTVEVFTPNGIPEMATFSTNVSARKDGSLRNSYYSHYSNVVTNYTFLEAGLELDHTPGNFPIVTSASDDYDFVRLELINYNDSWSSSWNLYGANPESIYYPNLPQEVIDALPEIFNDFPSQINYIVVEANQDSRFESYAEAADHLLEINTSNVQNYSSHKCYTGIQY